MLKKILSKLLDILFPENCIGCKQPDTLLCDQCISKIRPAERESARQILSFFDYRDPVMKEAMWKLKYGKKRHIAQILGNALYERSMEEIADMRSFTLGLPILVIPVPIHNKKKRLRGYNQAKLIAQHFVMSAPKNILEMEERIIVKTKATIPQARINNRNRRLANIKNAFAYRKDFNPHELRGRVVIVLDDITTTGGTLTEIIKLVEDAGVKKVVGFAVAH